MLRRCGSPFSTKYCRAIFSAASIASEPPLTKIDMADAGGRVRHQPVGQRLGGLGGEEARMRIGELVELRMQRRDARPDGRARGRTPPRRRRRRYSGGLRHRSARCPCRRPRSDNGCGFAGAGCVSCKWFPIKRVKVSTPASRRASRSAAADARRPSALSTMLRAKARGHRDDSASELRRASRCTRATRRGALAS